MLWSKISTIGDLRSQFVAKVPCPSAAAGAERDEAGGGEGQGEGALLLRRGSVPSLNSSFPLVSSEVAKAPEVSLCLVRVGCGGMFGHTAIEWIMIFCCCIGDLYDGVRMDISCGRAGEQWLQVPSREWRRDQGWGVGGRG